MAATPQQQPATAAEETPAPEPAAEPESERADALDFADLRAQATKIQKQQRYRGRLTMPMLRALEDLLNTPIPEEYLLHSEKTEGKPYDSTGLKSLQVQVDIANAVLGGGHWRLLTHYKTEHVCHAWVIIGNDVIRAKLSDDGEEVLPEGADIFLTRDGWGGVKRSNHEGDGRKGAQTNASKRALAQAGPGSNVYRLDFDEELVDGAAPAGEPAAAKAGSSRGQSRSADAGKSGRRRGGSQKPEETSAAKLKALLAKDDPLKALRKKANDGMNLLGFDDAKRLGWLEQQGKTEEELNGLIERANTALEAQTAQAESEAGDAK